MLTWKRVVTSFIKISDQSRLLRDLGEKRLYGAIGASVENPCAVKAVTPFLPGGHVSSHAFFCRDDTVEFGLILTWVLPGSRGHAFSELIKASFEKGICAPIFQALRN